MDTKQSEISERNVVISVIMNTIITVTEIVGGVISGSLALISDGLHNLSDTISGILTLWTLKLSHKEHTERFTFGYNRAEILSAIFNASLLLGIAIFLLFEAYKRFFSPEPIKSSIMIWVALIGLTANWISVFLLHKSAKHSLNIRSVYLHLLSDAFSSIGVVVGGLLMHFFKVYWVDPLIAILIACFIFKEGFKVIKETTTILMECAPEGINLNQLKTDIESIKHVKRLHHVHLWMLSDRQLLFEGHICIDDMLMSETKEIRKQIERLVQTKYGISHTTIQLEYNEHKNMDLIKKKC